MFTDLDAITQAAADSLRERSLRAVVAAGGDGTLAELVNRVSPDTPLAVFPLGTANLVANHLGITPRPDHFAAMLAAGKSLRIDAAVARAASRPHGAMSSAEAKSSATAGRVFLATASIGFDAAVVAELHAARTGHIRKSSYAKPILRCMRSYTYPRLRCRCIGVRSLEPNAEFRAGEVWPAIDGPGTEVEFEAGWLFVQNLACYAGGLDFTPEAQACDGLLDLCALRYGSIWHGLRYLGYVLAGRHARLPDCRVLRTRSLIVTSDSPAPLQLDGDPGGWLPLEIETLAGRVRLVAPAAALARLASPADPCPLPSTRR